MNRGSIVSAGVSALDFVGQVVGMKKGVVSSRLEGARAALAGENSSEVAMAMAPQSHVREFELTSEMLGRYEELNHARSRAVAAKTPSWQTTSPQYPIANTRRFIRGYRKNPVFRACVDILSNTFAQGRLVVEDRDTGEEIKNHPLNAAVRHPTNTRGEKDAWFRLIQDLNTTGNAIWEKVRGERSDKVMELWRLDPLRVRIELSADMGIKAYWYEVGGIYHPIPFRNIIHWKFVDPMDPGWFGIPPILSAQKELDVDGSLVDQLKITLQNRGAPSVVLEPADPKQAEGINTTFAEEARALWRKNFKGRGLGDVAVTNMKIRVIGMSWREMDLGEVISVPENRIAMVHRVPLILVGKSGTLGDPTRTNAEQAMEQLWFNTIDPLHGSIAELIDLFLLPEYQGWQKHRVRFDTSHVHILQKARIARAAMALPLFTGGGISRHHFQQFGGIPIHGPDVFHVGRKVRGVPADATTEETEVKP